jgi:hypothetical protein
LFARFISLACATYLKVSELYSGHPHPALPAPPSYCRFQRNAWLALARRRPA